MFCFSILTCCRSPFICDSSLSSHPGFDFLSVVLKGKPIFSQTNFAPAYIKSFNSVMLFVGMFVNKSFTFPVSDLTVLQSWFQREGNEVFFRHDSSNGIYISFFSSWVSVSVRVFTMHLSLPCSVWLGVCGFPEFGYVKSLLICLPISLFVDFQYYYYYCYYYYYLSIKVFFNISVSWWSFTGVRVTANRQDSS